MKLRFLLVFLVSVVVIFAILNGRFFIADAAWSLGIQPTISPPTVTSTSTPVFLPPLNPEKQGLYSSPINPITGNGSSLTRIQPVATDAVLIIDRIGVSAPIVFSSRQNDQEIYNNLERGVVHYPSTPKPGGSGVSIILGHSSAYPWYKGKYGSVFALLGKLHTGDKIRIEYSDGRVLNYNVTASIVFSPLANDPRLTQIENSSQSTLVLISCWPVGTNYKRIAIQAELIR